MITGKKCVIYMCTSSNVNGFDNVGSLSLAWRHGALVPSNEITCCAAVHMHVKIVQIREPMMHSELSENG
jgi:hypothetical protein